MTPFDDIVTLREELQRAAEPDRKLDDALARQVFRWTGVGTFLTPPWETRIRTAPPPYTMDFEAITEAIWRRWPGVTWTRVSIKDGAVRAEILTADDGWQYASATTAPMALCIAACRVALAEIRREARNAS